MMELFNVKPLGKRERFQFKCTRCGECCRKIKQSVMLESLDAYLLAKLLSQTDTSIASVEDMLLKYADPIPLTDTGFPIYVLKTVGDDDACIFLKENVCAVYVARPRTCRTYPITVGPAESGTDFDFDYLLCREKSHHFVGDTIRTKDWLRENFKREDQEFLRAEYESIAKLGRLIDKVTEHNEPRAITATLLARYYNYSLNQPFMPQFRRNMSRLELQLAELATNS